MGLDGIFMTCGKYQEIPLFELAGIRIFNVVFLAFVSFVPLNTRWWQLKYLDGNFTPNLGEDSQFD